jgi:L-ascorbate metabolism protein UlaG (beta-lactamase superfamily)
MGLNRETSFTWFGHSCMEVTTSGGRTILIDPWFANPKSPKTADAVDRCDVLLVTHGHFDHFDASVVDIARRTGAAWPCIHELSLYAAPRCEGTDAEIIGMNKGGTIEVRGLRVTMLGADHSAGDLQGEELPVYLGEPVGFIVEAENGFRFYVAGDTAVFGDMRLIRDLYAPELALLPIGGHFTMGPREAALAVELLGVQHVLPVHWGTFPLLTGTPDELRREIAARGLDDVTVHALEPGGVLR